MVPGLCAAQRPHAGEYPSSVTSALGHTPSPPAKRPAQGVALQKRARPLERASRRDDSAVPAVQPRAQPPPPDVCPPLGSEEEHAYDCPDYYYLRDFPGLRGRSH